MIVETFAPSVSFFVDEQFVRPLRKLPWRHPIEEWRQLGIKHLNIKFGAGRHPVVFVRVSGLDFAVKELGLTACEREVENYKELLKRGIHTLTPVGYVVREEEPIPVQTRIGLQYERNLVAHTVTLLMDRVLPDSLLYRRAFRRENRNRIWDAIMDLFVELHSNGVYWGDASLANTLVKFLKIDIPYIGKRTELKAFLADAETVEVQESITDSLRQADLDFFLESIEWIHEDLRAVGIMRDELATAQDKAYIVTRYERLYETAMKGRRFERLMGLSVRQHLGQVREAVYFESLEQHIAEHKWYLSEQQGKEVPFRAAAFDWLHRIFEPVCALLQREGVLDFFPGKTASELYVEAMTHKYYLSKASGKDVVLSTRYAIIPNNLATNRLAHSSGTNSLLSFGNFWE